MKLQNTDLFLVSKNGKNYQITFEELKMGLQDYDYLIVSRGGKNYKISGADLRNDLCGVGVLGFFVEIWGQGFPNTTLTASSGATTTVVNGGGGYTRLLMDIPNSYTLQIRPQYYIGGDNITTESIGGNAGTGDRTTTSIGVGGDAAGIGINGQWLAVVGGGGLGGYGVSINSSSVSYNGNTPFSVITYGNATAGGNGLGGYFVGTGNLSFDNDGVTLDQTSTTFDNDNSSPQPDVGGDSSSSTSGTITQPDQSQPGYYISLNSINSGAGGAGAPPGTGGSNGAAGQGGGANIKIWEEQRILDGYLTSFPDIRMKYIDSENGINKDEAKIRITSLLTGNFIDYTTNQDLLVSDILDALGN